MPLFRGEQSIDREKMIKREGKEGREQQQMHREIMIQDQRAKAAVIWAMVGRVKSVYRHVVVDKNKGDNYVVIGLVTSLVVPCVMAPTNLAFDVLALQMNVLA